MSPSRPLAGVALLLGLAACGEAEGTAPNARRVTVRKGSFAGYYTPEGRLERLVQDEGEDGRPEAVILYRPDGRMQYAEMDSNRDGTMDRWEYFGPGGALERIALAHRKPPQADEWQYLDPSGQTVIRKEFDDDGDGKADRVEQALPPGAQTTELDTSGNGKPDRRLVRDSRGEVIRVEQDPDEDGVWTTKPVVVR